MKKILFVLFLLGGCYSGFSQVGIGVQNPSSSAMLDIHSAEGNKGVLMPKIALIDKQSYLPITGNSGDARNIGLMVYNTTVDVAKDLSKGYYYWTGTQWNGLPDAAAIIDIINNNTSINGGVYYGKINGGTKEVLYIKKKDNNGNEIDEEIDIVASFLGDLTNISEENIFILKKVFGYDITEHVVYTGKSIKGKYHYSVYGKTLIQEGNAEVQGVQLNSETVRLLGSGNIYKINLLDQNQQIIDVNITDITIETGNVLKFSMGTSSIYYTLPAGEYGVIVELLSSLEQH